ncbi:MAG: hypothetical protein WCZ18_07340 [Ottowia sp.]|nr:hypothetical protein [Ottowia sp.]
MAVLYLALALHAPLAVRGDWIHDDGLFMQLAVDLSNGNWLGAYDNRTLAKGPGYALFLALGFVLGLPVSLSHALLHVAACLAFSVAMLRLSHSRWLMWVIYLILLWHPALLYGRVVRDTIYPSQLLLVCAGFICLLTAIRQGHLRPWVAVGTGIVLGWFWLTREEGIWLLPALAMLAILAVGWQIRDRRDWAGWLKGLALVVLAFAAVNLGNRALNRATYGVFVNTEFTGGEFKHALAVLQSVQVGPPQPYVPVPERTRAAIYEQSPAFSELRWYLESKDSPGYFWRGFGCPLYPSSCGDMAGGWFMWALRDAVAYSGHYDSAVDANTYYRRLANEVQAACQSGALKCRRSWLQFMPRITTEQWLHAPRAALRGLELLTFLREKPEAALTLPTGPPGSRPAEVKRVLGRPLTTPINKVAPDASPDWQHAADLPPSRMAKAARHVHQIFIKIYAIVLPLLTVGGLICFFVWAFRLWRHRSAQDAWMFGVALALWGLLGTRLALLVLIDISAFPGITPYYLLPAYALLCAAAVLSVYGCFARMPGKPGRMTDDLAAMEG